MKPEEAQARISELERQLAAAEARADALQEELDKTDPGVHSCGDHCRRPACVERRKTPNPYAPLIPPFHYDEDVQTIFAGDGTRVLEVEAWSFLAITLGLEDEEAEAARTKIGMRLAEAMNS